VKKSWEEQKHFIRQPTDKVAKHAKKTKQLVIGNLCALVRRLTDEIVYFFTPSPARAGHGQDGRATGHVAATRSLWQRASGRRYL
jgi:hypothetical protein